MKKSKMMISLMGGAAVLLMTTSAMAQETSFDEDGFTIEGDNVTVQIGGRLHLDTVNVSNDVTVFPDESDVRRFRIYGTVKFGDNWKAKVDGDVGGISTGLKNVWISYKGFENTTIKVGNYIAPFSGENMMSSNNIKFMERSLGSSLAPNFLVGGGATYKGEQWSVSGGYFGDPIDADPLRPTDKGNSYTARLVVAPIKEKRQVLHFAVAVENRQLDNGVPSTVRPRPEFGMSGTSLVNTTGVIGVDSYTNYNVEAAYMSGPFLVKGQMITRSNDAPTLGDPTYKASSVEGAWVLTGERQRYGLSGGTFGQVKPRRSGYGAIELAARYSTIDLTDALVAGGEEDNWTVGANWYLTRNMRVMVNYVNAETKPGANGVRENVNATMARFQIAY